MSPTRIVIACSAGLFLAGTGFRMARAQDPAPQDVPAEVNIPQEVPVDSLPVADPSCTYFGPNREKYIGNRKLAERAAQTANVVSRLAPAAEIMGVAGTGALLIPSAPGGSRTDTLQHTANNIDKYLFQ